MCVNTESACHDVYKSLSKVSTIESNFADKCTGKCFILYYYVLFVCWFCNFMCTCICICICICTKSACHGDYTYMRVYTTVWEPEGEVCRE